MNIDYLQLLKDSYHFTVKHKVLWLFGFIMTLFGAGRGSGNFSSFNNFNRSKSSAPSGNASGFNNTELKDIFDTFTTKVHNFTQAPEFIPVVISVSILVLLIILVAWYLNRISQSSIILATKYDSEGQDFRIGFKSLFGESNAKFYEIFVYDLIWLIPGFLVLIFVVLFILIPIIYLGPLSIILFCFLMPFLVVFALCIAATNSIGFKLMILTGISPVNAIKYGWHSFKSNFKDYFLAYIMLIIPGCVFSLVFLLFTILSLIPLLIPVFIIIRGGADKLGVGISLLVCLGGLAYLLISAIQSPYIVFQEAYWTKLIMKLMSKDNVRIP